MSEFVNYQKRAITLPPGCKDLIDVLEPSRRGTSAHKIGQTPQIKEEHFRTNGLAQVGRFVGILLNSCTASFTVMIIYRDDRTPVMLYRTANASVVMVAAENDDRARDIRSFFEQEGIQPFEDWTTSCTEAGGWCGLFYRLPPDPLDATRLVTDLLRQVLGLSDVAGLDFQYYEF